MAIGHRAFFRGEGEIGDALIVREPGTAVELFDLGVFENCDAVLVSSGHGGSLFLRGRGTHLFIHRAEADPEAARHVLGLPPTQAGCSRHLQSPYSLASRVLFILQAGYLKAKTLFFSFEIDEVAGRVCLTIENFNAASWYRG
jgi:hypothetical protein